MCPFAKSVYYLGLKESILSALEPGGGNVRVRYPLFWFAAPGMMGDDSLLLASPPPLPIPTDSSWML